MADTVEQTKAPASVNNHAMGRSIQTVTAAALTITCGFQPRYVRVRNVMRHTEEEWFHGMTAGTSVKRFSTGTGATGLTGITVNEHGFTIALDPDIVVLNETLAWVAIG